MEHRPVRNNLLKLRTFKNVTNGATCWSKVKLWRPQHLQENNAACIAPLVLEREKKKNARWLPPSILYPQGMLRENLIELKYFTLNASMNQGKIKMETLALTTDRITPNVESMICLSSSIQARNAALANHGILRPRKIWLSRPWKSPIPSASVISWIPLNTNSNLTSQRKPDMLSSLDKEWTLALTSALSGMNNWSGNTRIQTPSAVSWKCMKKFPFAITTSKAPGSSQCSSHRRKEKQRI